MFEFSRHLYLCNHLSESIHSWTKGTLPNPYPTQTLLPYPPLPYPTRPSYPTHPPTYPTQPYPLRIQTHAPNQASRAMQHNAVMRQLLFTIKSNCLITTVVHRQYQFPLQQGTHFNACTCIMKGHFNKCHLFSLCNHILNLWEHG